MKHRPLNLLARILVLAPFSSMAHADVHIGIGIGVPIIPPPLYYGPPLPYYSPPPPVYYGPGVVYGEGGWNYGGDYGGRDRGWAHDRWHGEHGGEGHGGHGHHGR